jgi:hypothetical protein
MLVEWLECSARAPLRMSFGGVTSSSSHWTCNSSAAESPLQLHRCLDTCCFPDSAPILNSPLQLEQRVQGRGQYNFSRYTAPAISINFFYPLVCYIGSMGQSKIATSACKAAI